MEQQKFREIRLSKKITPNILYNFHNFFLFFSGKLKKNVEQDIKNKKKIEKWKDKPSEIRYYYVSNMLHTSLKIYDCYTFIKYTYQIF